MSTPIPGIHHVTAIAGDPQRNVDFYTQVLGLRLVKVTVNFDDPGAYHLYFGDDAGRPGTILTFFAWPGAPRGRRGSGQIDTVSFSVPDKSMSFWMERLQRHAVDFQRPDARFDEEVLRFFDPDGLSLELVSTPAIAADQGRLPGPIPPDRAIIGFFGVTLFESRWQETESFLTGTLGFGPSRSDGQRIRFNAGQHGQGSVVDVLRAASPAQGRVAVGTVHHVAWRTPDSSSQEAWRKTILEQGFEVTPIVDRQYFTSIYFREPGGVLFEIATDPPGFAVDEDVAELGTHLVLPPWLEERRDGITASLPRLVLPGMERAA